MTVDTSYGKIEGIEEDSLLKFLGIPYAAPPVGELRFRRAKPHDKWSGIFKADRYGKRAPQFDHNVLDGSEDCLTLNIVRPSEGKKLPVFVWIHGGGYNTGCCDDVLYHGDSFAHDGVLYVNFQYRLNVLGFYDFTQYRDYIGVFETNCGLSDMILALKWIKENIEAFGGDGDNITIGGESAGGSAVVALMACPSAKGLFNRVIAQSALCNCVLPHKSAAKNIDLFIEGMGWSKKELCRLKTDDPLTFIKGCQYMEAHHQQKNPGIFEPCPCIDDLLPEYPLDAIKKGSARDVELLIGTNLNEGTMFVHQENTGFPNSWQMVEEMLSNNGLRSHLEDIKNYYLEKENDERYGSPFVHIATDFVWNEPSLEIALAQSRFNEVYRYRFEYVSPSGRKTGMLSSHAFELPFMFTVKNHEFSSFVIDGEDEKTIDVIMNQMHSCWVNFIKNGKMDENAVSVNENGNSIRIFDRTSRDESIDQSELVDLWKDIRLYRD